VVVERRLDVTVPSEIGSACNTLGQPPPTGGIEADRLIRSGPTRELSPFRRPTIGEYGLGVCAFGCFEEIQRSAHGVEVF
jgi:hypothetical protein